MPTNRPRMSWDMIRNYAELYQYTDPQTGRQRTSFNPPQGVKDKRQVPYHLTYITSEGRVESGQVITLKVYPRLRQRMVRFTDSGAIRRVRDYLVIEINGVRFVTT